MNCLECLELVQHGLDGVPADLDQAGADLHLAVCPECRELHAAAQRLSEGIRLYLPVVPPVGLAEQISARVLARQRQVRIFGRILTGAAVAAGLLLAVLFARSPHPAPPAEISDNLAELRQPTDQQVAPSLNHSVEEAGRAVVSLTRRAADETVGQGRWLFPVVVPSAALESRPAQPALEPPAQSLREMTQGMTAGLEPVTTSARRAVDLFLREIPPRGVERKPGI
jgi:hypothetical protein